MALGGERTFAWLGHYHRLSKDDERTIHSSQGVRYLASIGTKFRCLV